MPDGPAAPAVLSMAAALPRQEPRSGGQFAQRRRAIGEGGDERVDAGELEHARYTGLRHEEDELGAAPLGRLGAGEEDANPHRGEKGHLREIDQDCGPAAGESAEAKLDLPGARDVELSVQD